MTLARLLLRHATAVMPNSRRDWADGMAAELLIIDRPREALAFACGCILAAYQQRISPMRIALAIGRFGTTAVTLLTAGVHAAFLLYWVAILNDLKTHGMTGWVGRFPVFKGMSAEQALDGIGLIPAWHVAALVAMTLAFALCALMLAHRHFWALIVTAGTGLAINTGNALAMKASQAPYLVHHEIAWLYSLAFGLLILAAATFMLAERHLPAKAPATA